MSKENLTNHKTENDEGSSIALILLIIVIVLGMLAIGLKSLGIF